MSAPKSNDCANRTAAVAMALIMFGAVGATATSPAPPDFMASPVFYEMYSEEFSDTLNKRLMHEGKIRVAPLGIFDVPDFDWRTHPRNDLSFWLRMERMEYILPLMDSRAERDRALVDTWFRNWLVPHEETAMPNKGNRDAMAMGIRGMILTRYLKELIQYHPDSTLLHDRFRNRIQWTQNFLKNPSNFNMSSNHGMWESIGLFETTRVLPNPEVSKLALERLLKISTASVSQQGMHKEHSAIYHFFFLQWLSSYVGYLQSLEGLGWQKLPELAEMERKMHEAAFYLYDQERNIAQIGDTDKLRFDEEQAPKNDKRPEVWFDMEAGYAIFKDRFKSKRRRYVVFNIQNKIFAPTMRFHFHNDRQAVYYANDGENILSDQGRFSYQGSGKRRYVQSCGAHNTIMRKAQVGYASLELCDDVWRIEERGEDTFGAKFGPVTRSVTIPHKKEKFVVEDVVSGTEQAHTIHWHIGPDVTGLGVDEPVEKGNTRTYRYRLTTQKGREHTMTISVVGNNGVGGPEAEIRKGDYNPMVGWFSPDYNVMWPINVVRINLMPRGPMTIRMEIERTN